MASASAAAGGHGRSCGMQVMRFLGLVRTDPVTGEYMQWVDPSRHLGATFDQFSGTWVDSKLLGVVPRRYLHYQIGEPVSTSLLCIVPRVLYLPVYTAWHTVMVMGAFPMGLALLFFVMVLGFLLCWLLFWSVHDMHSTIEIVDIVLDVPVTVLNTGVFGVNYAYGMLRPALPTFNSAVFNVVRLIYTVGRETWEGVDMIMQQLERGSDAVAGALEDDATAPSLLFLHGAHASMPSVPLSGAQGIVNSSSVAAAAAATTAYSMFVPCYRQMNHGLTAYEDPLCMSVLNGDTFNNVRMWAINVMVNIAVLFVKVLGFFVRGFLWGLLEGIFQLINFFTSGDFVSLCVWFVTEIARWVTEGVDSVVRALQRWYQWAKALLEWLGDGFVYYANPLNWGTPQSVKSTRTFDRALHYVKHQTLLSSTGDVAWEHVRVDMQEQADDARDVVTAVLHSVHDGSIANNTWCGEMLLSTRDSLREQVVPDLDKLSYGTQWGFVACVALVTADTLSHVHMRTEPGVFLSPVKLLRAVAELLNMAAPQQLLLEQQVSKFSEDYDKTGSTMLRMYKTLGHPATDDPVLLEYDESESDSAWDTNTRFMHNSAVTIMRGLRGVERSAVGMQRHQRKALRHASQPALARAHWRKVRAHLVETTNMMKRLTRNVERESSTPRAPKPWTTSMRFDDDLLMQSKREQQRASSAEQAHYDDVRRARGEFRRGATLASTREQPSNLVLRWIASTFPPNREGSVPLLDLLNPSKTITRILDTMSCWNKVDFSCGREDSSADTGSTDASDAADPLHVECKSACAEEQSAQLADGTLTLERVSAATEACLQQCDNAKEQEAGMLSWAAGGLADFFQMCWPPNRNGVPWEDERRTNETQCFPQLDELFHLEYFFFNFEQWLLDATASADSHAVCTDYKLELWDQCNGSEGMYFGTCVLLADTVPLYFGLSNAFINKLSNFFTASEHLFAAESSDADVACFWLVGMWCMLWVAMLILLLVFVFVVFERVSVAIINFALAPLYVLLTATRVIPTTPPGADRRHKWIKYMPPPAPPAPSSPSSSQQ